MPNKPPEIGELICSTDGYLGYVTDCNYEEGVFDVEWFNRNMDFYSHDMIILFRDNLRHFYGDTGNR